MIDGATRTIAALLSPAVASEPAVDAGPAFATVLMQAMVRDSERDRDGAPPMPGPPVASPALSVSAQPDVAGDVPLPAPAAVVADPGDVDFRNQPVVDHAVRFDARGVLNMAATRTGAVDVDRSGGVGFPGGVVAKGAGEIPNPVEASLPARTLLLPETTLMAASTAPVAGGAARTKSTRSAPPAAFEPVASPSFSYEPEVVASRGRGPRPRAPATMAQGAPQVAVAALADGLAVVAAVGALSDAERHRLRDAIAATVARHGYHPRTVTLLAMPAPVRFPES